LGEGGQHGGGRLDAALFQAGVVVGADDGELGDLLAAQARHPARRAGLGQAHGAGAQLGTAGLEEFPQLVEVCVAGHGHQCRTAGTPPEGEAFIPG
jgi:hypothetical protein